MNGSRVTIYIPDDILKRVRNHQAKIIRNTSQNYSLSAAISDILEGAV